MPSKDKRVRQEIENAVYASILALHKERMPDMTELNDNQQLVSDLGLRSMDQVRLIAELEKVLHVDPFCEGEYFLSETSTIEEVCTIYENFLISRR